MNPTPNPDGGVDYLARSGPRTLGRQRDLVEALRDPACYPHTTRGDIAVVETHLAWVLLTGRFAYKIKKALDVGFADFSTPERRKHFCLEELRLNSRLTSNLYLDVVTFDGSPSRPLLREHGTGFEYAVRMREFDQRNLASHLLTNKALGFHHIDAIARTVTSLHDGVSRLGGHRDDYGSLPHVLGPMLENVMQVLALGPGPTLRSRIHRLGQLSRSHCQALTDLMERRRRSGFVRECHGDLRLENIVLEADRVTIFDCVESNPNLRWIDTANEIAFTMMDLEYRGATTHATRFLNAWLEQNGDYDALWLIGLYKRYRAMARAKVAAMRARQEGRAIDDDPQVQELVGLAESYEAVPAPGLLITHGGSGTGTSRIAQVYAQEHGAVRLRSDIERKRLHGLEPMEATGSEIWEGTSDDASTERTYTRLAEVAEICVRAGWTVVVDAAFLRRRHRALFRDLAARLKVSFTILDVRAERSVIERRLAADRARTDNPCEAGAEVRAAHSRTRDPLTRSEREIMKVVYNSVDEPPC